MNDFITKRITPIQREHLQNLNYACRKAEPILLGIPEDGDIYLFSCGEDEQILSCIIVCFVQKNNWECYAYTHPEFRKKGLFSHLLEMLCAEAEKAENDSESVLINLVFLLDGKSQDALAAVQAMGMNFWHSEHQMERIITTDNLSGLSASSALSSFPSEIFLRRRKIREEETEGWLFMAFLKQDKHGEGEKFLGSCRLLSYNASRFYLYHVEICREFRSQGWGKRLLETVFTKLPKDCSVFLHVSSDNAAAVSLYKKTGFHITETLSYYVY